MRTFDLQTPADAMAKLNAALAMANRTLPIETINTFDAHNRVLAQDILAPTPLPEFRRSTVDGYAVRATDVPGTLRLTGEVNMGEISELQLHSGTAIAVPTGGHVPEGATAVVMVEQTQAKQAANGERMIEVSATVNAGDNTIAAGEDVGQGDVVIRAGARLREQEIAGLLALGIVRVPVRRRPRVAVIASGDELVSADAELRTGQIRNTNGPMMLALVKRCGGEPIDFGILPDQRSAFEHTAQRAMRDCDAVIFMAGSSVGEKDFVPDVVNAMGAPGILVHGIAFRPGKPTLFAVADGKPVFGLPGNPISALVTALLFVSPTLWQLQGTLEPQPSFVTAILSEDVQSPKNLEHWVPVKLHSQPAYATPISTKSNLIFGLVRASGLVCVPIGVSKLNKGDPVQVRLFA